MSNLRLAATGSSASCSECEVHRRKQATTSVIDNVVDAGHNHIIKVNLRHHLAWRFLAGKQRAAHDSSLPAFTRHNTSAFRSKFPPVADSLPPATHMKTIPRNHLQNISFREEPAGSREARDSSAVLCLPLQSAARALQPCCRWSCVSWREGHWRAVEVHGDQQAPFCLQHSPLPASCFSNNPHRNSVATLRPC